MPGISEIPDDQQRVAEKTPLLRTIRTNPFTEDS